MCFPCWLDKLYSEQPTDPSLIAAVKVSVEDRRAWGPPVVSVAPLPVYREVRQPSGLPDPVVNLFDWTHTPPPLRKIDGAERSQESYAGNEEYNRDNV